MSSKGPITVLLRQQPIAVSVGDCRTGPLILFIAVRESIAVSVWIVWIGRLHLSAGQQFLWLLKSDRIPKED